MKTPKIIERIIYTLVIALSLIAVGLVLNAPANFLNARVVYQGF